jgi:hypothetical protein
MVAKKLVVFEWNDPKTTSNFFHQGKKRLRNSPYCKKKHGSVLILRYHMIYEVVKSKNG